MAWDFSTEPDFQRKLDWMRTFVREQVWPLETLMDELGWDGLRQAARHSEAVEEVLLADYELSKAQVDGLWAYVGNKGQKGDMRSARIVESSGAVR